MRLLAAYIFACVFLSAATLVAAFYVEQQSTADRRQAIAECKAAGGLPVVLAGQISSEGIGCAQPLGQ